MKNNRKYIIQQIERSMDITKEFLDKHDLNSNELASIVLDRVLERLLK